MINVLRTWGMAMAIAVAFAGPGARGAPTALRLNGLLADHAVVQRGKPIDASGMAAPGESLVLSALLLPRRALARRPASRRRRLPVEYEGLRWETESYSGRPRACSRSGHD